jgi:uncharacterized protein
MKSLKLLLVLLLAVCSGFAEKVANLPAPTAYVDDYANAMTPAGKAQVEAVCRDVHAKTRAQIFVVIIKSLEGEPIAQFANDLFHTWKIGEKKTDRGVLVLLVQDHHRWRIEVGSGLEGILPDAKAGRIGRAMDPSIKAGDYDAAAKSSVDAIAAAIAEDTKVTLGQPDASPAPASAPPRNNDSSGAIIVLFIIVAFCFFSVVGWFRRRAMAARGYPGYPDSGASGFIAGPTYFGSDSSGSSSSDFSSSSSDDSSSSSDSFSGGDGGDSGGGGADGGGDGGGGE